MFNNIYYIIAYRYLFVFCSIYLWLREISGNEICCLDVRSSFKKYLGDEKKEMKPKRIGNTYSTHQGLYTSIYVYVFGGTFGRYIISMEIMY